MDNPSAGAQCALFDLAPEPDSPGCDLTAGSGPNLANDDIILMNMSGGKDSQYAAMVLAAAARAADVLDRVVAVHAYLAEDWPDAEDYARMHAAAYGIGRFETVSREQTLLEHVEERGMWPSSKARYCTSEHKRGPISALMTRLTAEVDPVRLGRPVRILNVMGMRAEESSARAKRVAFRHNARESNLTRRHVDEWLPIHEASLTEVRTALDASGVPHHPAYDGDDGEPWAGMSRLSCVLCVLGGADDLVLAARRQPRRAAEYLRVEVSTGHDFKLGLPMREIIRRAARRAVKRG